MQNAIGMESDAVEIAISATSPEKLVLPEQHSHENGRLPVFIDGGVVVHLRLLRPKPTHVLGCFQVLG